MVRSLLRLICWCAVSAASVLSATEALRPEISWSGYPGKALMPPQVTRVSGPEGLNAVRIEAAVKSPYQGALAAFKKPVDFTRYRALEFYLRHNITGKNGGKLGMVIMVFGQTGRAYCEFVTPASDWSKVVIPLDAGSFTAQRGNTANLIGIREMRIYPSRAMDNAGEFLEIAGVTLLPESSASGPLKVMNYKHLNEPTSGENGHTLTDGDKSRNVFYRIYSDDPDIVFDLGGRFAIDEIKLHSNCAPGHNFSEMAIMLSYDGKSWNPAGVLHNTEQSTRIQQTEYSFKAGGKPLVGRYVRFRGARLRSDHTVNIAEIEFTGHTPSAAEIAKAAESNYDRGPAMPERSAKDYVKLAKDDFTLWISRTNGVVNGLFYKNKLLAERLAPRYTLQTRKLDTLIDGNLDKVQDIKSNPDGSVTVTTVNAKLPELTVKRTWRIKDQALWEKVEIHSRMKERKFLQIATGVILEQNFRKNGFYEMPGTAIAAGMVRTPAGEVQMDRALTNIPTVAFENARANLTLWHNRYFSNGRFAYMDVGTEEGNLQYFKPNGWMITAVTIVPADAPVQSIENRLAVTEGGMLKAYDQYISTPEAAAYRSRIKRPAWLRDLRCDVSQGWDASYPQSNIRHFANMKDAFSSRGYLMECSLFDMGGTWGDLPTKGWVYNWFGGRQTPEELRAKIRQMKKQNPQLKVGCYSWFWSAFFWSTPVKDHPEWFVRTLRSGAPASWFPGVNINYLRFFGIRESREEATRQIVNAVNYYKQDNWYLDGGKSGAYAKDWETMRIDDILGQTEFYLETREEIKKNDPDRVVYFNHSMNPLGDLGYLESFGGTLTNEWRRGAILMWKFKLYNYKDPLHHSVYTYWLPGVDGSFHNYMSGIGVVGSYCSRHFSTRDLPFIGARYEIRQAQLRDAAVKPDWRHDWQEELELMALQQGKNGWIFINPHETGKVKREISFRTAPLGLTEGNKPLYVWCYTIKDGKNYKAQFSEKAIAEAYKKCGWISERAVVPVYLGKRPHTDRYTMQLSVQPGQAQILMLSQVPAVIVSVAGEPAHYYLAEQPDVKISGDNGRFTVDSEWPAEIGLLLEKDQIPAAVTVNGQMVEAALRIEKNMRLAVVPVKPGRSEIVLETRKAPAVDTVKLEVSRKQRTLIVKTQPDNAPVQIYSEGNLVLSRNGSFTLELPDTVRDGSYVVTSGKLSRKISLRKLGKPMKFRPILKPLKVTSEVKAVNKVINNIKVYSQGTSATLEASQGQADAERLTLTAEIRRIIESHFNQTAAMLEIDARRYLKIRVHNGFIYNNKYGYQPKRHNVRRSRPNIFAGLILDFGTPGGYTVRSAASMGIQSEKRNTPQPEAWGKKAKQDRIFHLNSLLLDPEIETAEYWLDLAKLGAPADWNGRLCISAYLEDINPCRSLKVEILESRTKLPAGAAAAEATELGKVCEPRVFEIPEVTGPVDWDKVPVLGKLQPATAATARLAAEVKAVSDGQNLYFCYHCEEKPGRILNTEGGKANKPWWGDGVEFFVGMVNAPDRVYHTVIDAANVKYAEDAPLIRTAGAKCKTFGRQTRVRAKFDIKDGHWTAVVTIPWELLGGQPEAGQLLPFNLMRNRLEKGEPDSYTLVPGGEYFSGKLYQFKLKK